MLQYFKNFDVDIMKIMSTSSQMSRINLRKEIMKYKKWRESVDRWSHIECKDNKNCIKKIDKCAIFLNSKGEANITKLELEI